MYPRCIDWVGGMNTVECTVVSVVCAELARELWFFVRIDRSISWLDVIHKRRLLNRDSLVLLGLVLGFLVFVLGVVGSLCQYHGQMIGWKDLTLK